MTFLSTIRVSSLTIQTLLLFFFAKFIYFHNLPVVQRVEFLQCSFSYIFTTDVKCLTYLWKAKGNPRLNTYNYKVTIGIFIFRGTFIHKGISGIHIIADVQIIVEKRVQKIARNVHWIHIFANSAQIARNFRIFLGTIVN